MSDRGSPEMGLRLNGAPSPRAASSSSSSSAESPVFSSSPRTCSSEMTYEGPCVVSSEAEETVQDKSVPETKAMQLVGCPQCLMYVMLSEVDPKCPKCKSTSFLDFLKEEKSENTDK